MAELKKQPDYSNQKIIEVDLKNEMKTSYIDYAMSVIVGRALPDVRDGMKPVHRRIIYAMAEDGFTPDKAHRKCATTVGDVLGRYHPHGDAAVYDALARMAQDFSLRYMLIDGHGNFGSVDGDPPAAYRYTEARISKVAMEMVRDIDKETIDYVRNYDDTRDEPVVLPSRIPNLLVNGSSGIAVGMATNIPPHNLGEVIDGLIAMIDDEEISIDELMEYIKGPDFPTAGIIMGRSGIRAAYHTGKGRIVLRAKAEIEEHGGRQRIVVRELPYQVNKARLQEKIAELVKDKRIEGISDLRDESDRDGMRLIIEIKKDANANIVLNNLYKFTQMQDSFCVTMLALVNNTDPRILNLKEALYHYLKFQREIITRRTEFNLKKAKAEAHLLEGRLIALNNIDEVIKIIRESYDDAEEKLIKAFGLSEIQAQDILNMRLKTLQGLEKEKIEDKYNELVKLIDYYNSVLEDKKLVDKILKDELSEIKEKYSDDRKTSIENVLDDLDIEDLIEEEEGVITLTHLGYIKRTASSIYKSQHRGGRGIAGLQTREEDFVERLFTASTHDHIMFFTNKGRMYKLKGYQIPEAGRQAKGTAIVNILPFEPGEKVSAMIPVKEFTENMYLTMATRNGVIKKTDLMEYNTARKGGLIAIVIDPDDELIRVELTDGNQDVVIGTHDGYAIRFNETDVRPMGRVTRGVKSINLRENDFVVGMSLVKDDTELLVVTENGFGKKTNFDEYKVQRRGGMGLLTYKVSEKTGKVCGITSISPNDDVMLMASDGVIIRMYSQEINSLGRATIGVRLMRPEEGVNVIGIVSTVHEEEEKDDTSDTNEPEAEETQENLTEEEPTE
ncbi:MAG: DNA gyrase subunit A [Bacillota bacterium]|nr:DNA gyrase subunit A [Bacillota bacterium]